MPRQRISDKQRTDPQVDAELEAEHGVEQAGGGDQDAGRQIELAADHQHADGDGDDADDRGLVEHREEGGRRTERGRHDQEEDEDDDRGHQGAHLGAGQQPIGQTECDSVRGLRRRGRWRSLDSLTHGGSDQVRVVGQGAGARASPRSLGTSGCFG